jgi:L-cystine uptake protein TcyP (sodium:dicarboxylate symporter family)
MVTPFAVLSLIIKAIATGSQSDLANAFSNVGYLVVATIAAMIAYFFRGPLWTLYTSRSRRAAPSIFASLKTREL